VREFTDAALRERFFTRLQSLIADGAETMTGRT
jgi:hypothetical protein